MPQDDDVTALLRRIEENQRQALDAQREQLDIAKAQLERSNQSIQESIELQRAAVAKQTQIAKFVLPVIGVLLALVVYLAVKWDVL